MSELVKPVTGSLKVTVTGIGVVAVGLLTAELIPSVGLAVSMTTGSAPDAAEIFPATSVATAVML